MNAKPISKVYLAPGDFYFGGGRTRIYTLLGSCVAITMWHPARLIGGMCHYLLPKRGTNRRLSEGYFADDAIQLFLDSIQRHGTRPQDYEVKLFGGGSMFKMLGGNERSINVPGANAELGQQFLRQHGFKINSTDLGGERHRKVYLELWSGDVWVKR